MHALSQVTEGMPHENHEQVKTVYYVVLAGEAVLGIQVPYLGAILFDSSFETEGPESRIQSILEHLYYSIGCMSTQTFYKFHHHSYHEVNGITEDV